MLHLKQEKIVSATSDNNAAQQYAGYIQYIEHYSFDGLFPSLVMLLIIND
jgi:hypothetical protein